MDKTHKPDLDNELVVSFRVQTSEGFTVEEAAGRLASESSVGTWTTLAGMPKGLRSLMAKAYEITDLGDGSHLVRVAYPVDLFEPGNMPGIIASIAGNILGMRAIRGARLEDVYLPKPILDGFKGPVKGIEGVRRVYRVYDRPIVGTVPKPKVGYDVLWLKDVAYQILSGGMDYIKDDENLTSQSFCKFEDRAKVIMRVIERVEKETGERKVWLANVTADVREMVRRAKLVADYGNPFIMVDVVIAGWSSLSYIRDVAEEYGLGIHAHRAFHAAFTRNRYHGLSMFVLAKLLRAIGVDQLHVGTPEVGKLEARRKDVLDNVRVLRESSYKPDPGDKTKLPQDWHHIKPALPTSSGGLHPGTLPEVIKHMGVDLVIQVGGGVLGHPDGPRAGARAVRQSIEAAVSGVSLEEYARSHKELERALEKWGLVVPA